MGCYENFKGMRMKLHHTEGNKRLDGFKPCPIIICVFFMHILTEIHWTLRSFSYRNISDISLKYKSMALMQSGCHSITNTLEAWILYSDQSVKMPWDQEQFYLWRVCPSRYAHNESLSEPNTCCFGCGFWFWVCFVDGGHCQPCGWVLAVFLNVTTRDVWIIPSFSNLDYVLDMLSIYNLLKITQSRNFFFFKKLSLPLFHSVSLCLCLCLHVCLSLVSFPHVWSVTECLEGSQNLLWIFKMKNEKKILKCFLILGSNYFLKNSLAFFCGKAKSISISCCFDCIGQYIRSSI